MPEQDSISEKLDQIIKLLEQLVGYVQSKVVVRQAIPTELP